MNLERSSLTIQDENAREPERIEDYPTFADLMREQNISSDDKITVHFRRDLDSLG